MVDDICRGESGNRLHRLLSADLVRVFSDAGGYLAHYLGLAANQEKQADFLQTDFIDGAGGSAVGRRFCAAAVPD